MAKRINPNTGKWEDVEDSTIETNAPPSVKAFIPDLSDDDLRKLAREKISEALQAINPVEQPELTRKLCAEVKDRLDGRPTQAVDVSGKIGIVQIVLEAAKRSQVIENVPTISGILTDN